jgi:hypothetical protein
MSREGYTVDVRCEACGQSMATRRLIPDGFESAWRCRPASTVPRGPNGEEFERDRHAEEVERALP